MGTMLDERKIGQKIIADLADGGNLWVHNSADNREAFERKERKMN